MIELTAIEATLDTRMANHIVEIDEQNHARLDMIKEKNQNRIAGYRPGWKSVAPLRASAAAAHAL